MFRNFLYNIPVPDKSFVIELLTCNFVFFWCGIIINLNHPLITYKKKDKDIYHTFCAFVQILILNVTPVQLLGCEFHDCEKLDYKTPVEDSCRISQHLISRL